MCPHCDELYDADTNVEHEEMCKDKMEYYQSQLDKQLGKPLKKIDEIQEQLAKDQLEINKK